MRKIILLKLFLLLVLSFLLINYSNYTFSMDYSLSRGVFWRESNQTNYNPEERLGAIFD